MDMIYLLLIFDWCKIFFGKNTADVTRSQNRIHQKLKKLYFRNTGPTLKLYNSFHIT